MGIFSSLKSFFVGNETENSRLPDINQNALTPETFTPNQDNLYVSSELVREVNNRGWIVDDELVQQSGEIAKNAKQNAKNVKKFGKNIKTLSKAELLTAKEMQKAIKLTADGDSKKYGIVIMWPSCHLVHGHLLALSNPFIHVSSINTSKHDSHAGHLFHLLFVPMVVLQSKSTFYWY